MNCFCECEFREACEGGGDKVFVTNKSSVFVANGRTGEILQRILVENDEEAAGPLAVDGDDLYVVTKTGGVYVYSMSGLVIKRRFGDCEAFQKGSGIVVGRDDVYVADGEQNRLVVFQKETGHFDRVLLGGGCAFVCHPTSIALYKNRFLIVAEMCNSRIQVFDITQKNDRLILVLDGFLNVSSVVVNPTNGVVYASLYSLRQIRKFQLLVNEEDESLVCHVQARTRQLDCSPRSLFLSCGDTKLGIVTNTRLCFLDMF